MTEPEAATIQTQLNEILDIETTIDIETFK